MPWLIPGSNDFTAQFEMLHELLQDDPEILAIGNSIFKIVTNHQITYWHGNADASKVSIIVDTEVTGNFCKVQLTSKNPQLSKSTPPFTSDMYIAIKQDLASSDLTFTSDSMMTSDAINLWTRVANSGGTIGVFDTTLQKYILRQVASAEEMRNFCGGPDCQKYIFVLSESALHFAGTKHSVGLMEIKRLAGYPIFEFMRGAV